jgi:hypothetical protein
VAPGLLAKLTLLVGTPRPGRHVPYRCDRIEGNQELAKDDDQKTTVETRGDGGYIVAAGSPLACHPSGRPYEVLKGSWEHVPTITPDERDILLGLARSFNRHKPPDDAPSSYASNGDAHGDRPGDEYNARASWDEVLTPSGWTVTGQCGQTTYWKRPGKTEPGRSAISGNGDDRLCVFTSNAAPLEKYSDRKKTYSKFQAYSTLYHGGNFTEAAKALVGMGYGRNGQPHVSDEEELPYHETGVQVDRPNHDGDEQQPYPPSPKMFFRKKTFIPKRLADYLLTQYHIKYAAGMLWVYRNGVYVSDGEHILAAAAQQYLGEERRQNRIEETLRYIEVATYTEMPPADLQYINLLNGRLEWSTGILHQHTPDVFSVMQLPVHYDQTATCPTFDQYLDTTLDKDVIPLVDEVIGDHLIPDTRYEKATMLTGDGGNGKSVFIDTLTALLGSQHVSNIALNIALQDLEENRFLAAELFGKLGNFFADLDPRALKTSSLFKTLVTGDEIQAERKFRDPFKFRNVARLLFSANKLPDSSDRTLMRTPVVKRQTSPKSGFLLFSA